MNKQPKFPRILVFLTLIIVWFVWLNFFEEAFWRFKFDLDFLIFLALTFNLLSIYIYLIKYSKDKLIKSFGMLIGLFVSSIALLSFCTFLIADLECLDWRESNIVQEIEKGRLPKGVDLLMCGKNFAVIGKKRSFRSRFLGLRFPDICVCEFEEFYNMIPKDFREYASLLQPSGWSWDKNWSEKELLLAYFTWQFPVHLPYVVHFYYDGKEDHVNNCDHLRSSFNGTHHVDLYFSEDNRTGPAGVYPTDPWIKDIVSCGLLRFFTSRIRSYSNMIKYLFIPQGSGYSNDPYFLIGQGKIQEAKKLIPTLPRNRREFLLEKLINEGVVNRGTPLNY